MKIVRVREFAIGNSRYVGQFEYKTEFDILREYVGVRGRLRKKSDEEVVIEIISRGRRYIISDIIEALRKGRRVRIIVDDETVEFLWRGEPGRD